MQIPQHPQGYTGNTRIALYNLTQDTVVYSRKLVYGDGTSRVFVDPVISGDKIYIAGGGFVACNNVYTGESIWTRPSRDIYGGLLLDGNTLLANSDTDGADLYALNKDAGYELWSTPSADGSSFLSALNGVVYFSGLGKLHAVDIATGDHIWRLESPDIAHNSDAFLQPQVVAIPGRNGNKGIILTSSYLSAMAFEAVR